MRFFVVRLLLFPFLAAAVLAQADEPRCSTPAHECEQQIRAMLSGRRYLGVQVVELKPSGGLVIKAVNADSPAGRAGLKENDRIVAVNGKNLEQSSGREFKQILYDARETGTIFMIIRRRGALRKVELKLEAYTKEQIDKIIEQHLMQAHQATASRQ